MHQCFAAGLLAVVVVSAEECFKATITHDLESYDPIILSICPDLAPLGVDRFKELVEAKFFDKSPFFRYVPSFIVQFGIAYDPDVNSKWAHNEIEDDPVLTSNMQGTIVFATAGPDTRTSQLFINFKDNSGLDAQGFAPFGNVVSGLESAVAIFNPTPDDDGGIDQNMLSLKGGEWADAKYPGLNHITTVTIE